MGRVQTKRMRYPPGAHRGIRIPSSIIVRRIGAQYAIDRFQACVQIGSDRLFRRKSDIAAVCGFGKNPRRAVAAALRFLATRVSKRSGAFKGIR